jgi:hypothetical protein
VSKGSDASAEGEQEHSFTRELGLTHTEFYRSLPPAIAPRAFTRENDRVQIDLEPGTVTIELGPQKQRSIASLRLPYVEVRFTFSGLSIAQRQAFMERFEIHFHRGGG